MVRAEPGGADETAISRLLHGMFDKPGETLSVEPIVVSGEHALAGWTQGQMGGRALLRRQHQAWSLVLCAGDGIKSKQALAQGGVPSADAEKIATSLAAAEARLAPERVAMFSRFEGVMMMDGKDDEGSGTHHH